MNWQEILTTLVPLVALMGWLYKQTEARINEAQRHSDAKADERQRYIEASLMREAIGRHVSFEKQGLRTNRN